MPLAYPSMPDAKHAVAEMLEKTPQADLFEFGDYMRLASKKAARARSLCTGALLIWLSIVVARQPLARCSPSDLADGIMSVMQDPKYKAKLINKTDHSDSVCVAWFGRQTCTALTHLRRLKRVPDKYTQATRNIPAPLKHKPDTLLEQLSDDPEAPSTKSDPASDAESEGQNDDTQNGDTLPDFDYSDDDMDTDILQDLDADLLAERLLGQSASSSREAPLPAERGALKRKALSSRPVSKRPSAGAKGCSKCRWTSCSKCADLHTTVQKLPAGQHFRFRTPMRRLAPATA